MKVLGAYHFGCLSYDVDNCTLFAGHDSDKFVELVTIADKSFLKFKDNFISPHPTLRDVYRLTQEMKQALACLPSATANASPNNVLIPVPGGFLSARPEGQIIMMANPREWEHFRTHDSDDATKFATALSAYCQRNAIKKLACCSGPVRFSDGDWFLTDIKQDLAHGIYPLDISKRFPIESNCFDFIIIEHGIEHVNLDGVINFCKESARILKKMACSGSQCLRWKNG